MTGLGFELNLLPVQLGGEKPELHTLATMELHATILTPP